MSCIQITVNDCTWYRVHNTIVSTHTYRHGVIGLYYGFCSTYQTHSASSKVWVPCCNQSDYWLKKTQFNTNENRFALLTIFLSLLLLLLLFLCTLALEEVGFDRLNGMISQVIGEKTAGISRDDLCVVKPVCHPAEVTVTIERIR